MSSIVSLSSCRPDDNGGDIGGTDTPGDDSSHDVWEGLIPLVKEGEVNFTLVSKYSTAKEIFDLLKSLKDALKAEGLTVDHKYQMGDEDAIEILVGTGISAKGDFYVNEYDLGLNGYLIKAVDNKIVIIGGTDEMTAEALRVFLNEYIGIGKEDTDIKNIGVSSELHLEKKPVYDIKSVTVDGRDIMEYKIVTDLNDEFLDRCAKKLRDAIYTYSGKWVDIAGSSDGPAIRLDYVADAGDEGFIMTVKDGDLVLECEYALLMEECVDHAIEHYLIPKGERELAFTEDEVLKKDISKIGYCSYGGAVGDGVTDDFEALRNTHKRANITGQTVVAEPGKSFNVGQHPFTIYVKTDAIWTGAFFIVDDSKIDPSDTASVTNIFTVIRENNGEIIEIPNGLKAGQENVGLTFDTDVMLFIANSNVKQYIRRGENGDSGADQQELILVDKDGNVDPTTPIMWDYDVVTYAAKYDISDKPITITGGTFITIANKAPRQYTYYNRGIGIGRSNVTIRGLSHSITGEGDTGAPYTGFLAVNFAANVLMEDIRLQGHKMYWLSGSEGVNAMGTYDISANASINVTWRNVVQSNSINDTAYWGIMGSNYCKNLTYDGCKLSRFDAHKGTWNATIINSEIGHDQLSLIGGGQLYVENTVIHGNSLVGLRGDYGSTWNGDMYFKNVTLNNSSANPVLISAVWASHNYGYICHLPNSVVIDGITLKTGTSFRVFTALSANALTDSVNPIEVTKTVSVISNPNNYTYTLASSTSVFGNTELLTTLPEKKDGE